MKIISTFHKTTTVVLIISLMNLLCLPLFAVESESLKATKKIKPAIVHKPAIMKTITADNAILIVKGARMTPSASVIVLQGALMTTSGNIEILSSVEVTANPKLLDNNLLCPGDTLEIDIINNPELNTKQIITPEGSISIPQIGRIVVKDLTLTELDTFLLTELSKYYEKPIFSVFLTPRSIYVVQYDMSDQTSQVVEASNPSEATALMGGATNTLNYGDVVTVNIGRAPAFWEDNWYKLLTGVGIVIVGVWNK